MTIIKLHIPCELCRFFIESIGIVLAIPVSILITSVINEINDKKGEEDMLMILGFILLFLIMIIGRDEGVNIIDITGWQDAAA